MDTAKFESELHGLLPLVLTYGANFYNLTEETFEEKLKRIPHKDFVNKCHEGFKQAQKIIIATLLSLEGEIKSTKKKLEAFVTLNPHHPQKTPEYKTIQEQIMALEFQEASFREAANVIAWNMLGFDQPCIKMFAQLDMHHGHLSDQNLKSVIGMADEINTDENSFALINDITSILGVGDLLIAQNGMRELVEVKEGKINALIAKLFEENKQDDPAAIDELSKIHGPYIADQIKRFGKQKQTMDAVIDYIKTGTGKDLIYGVYKNKYEVKTPTDGFNKLVHAAIDRFYVDRRSLLVPLDCCWVGIFDKTGISEQVRIWDFMHYLYHTLTKPWDQCDYLKPKEQQNFTKNNPPEFFVYSITPIYLIKNKVRTFSHQPLFLTLKSKYAIDLMVDKFGLYVYFDVDNFAALSAQQGLQIRWLTQSQMDKFNSGERIRNLVLPRFNGRYLQLEYNNNSCVFSYGHLYRLIYEFQSGYSLVEQIKEFLAAELFAKGLESFPLSPKSKQYESK